MRFTTNIAPFVVDGWMEDSALSSMHLLNLLGFGASHKVSNVRHNTIFLGSGYPGLAIVRSGGVSRCAPERGDGTPAFVESETILKAKTSSQRPSYKRPSNKQRS